MNLDEIKQRCAAAICADCGGAGRDGKFACESCGGHEDAAGSGIASYAEAVEVIVEDVPALVAEVERLRAGNGKFAVADSPSDLCVGPDGRWMRVRAPDEGTAEQAAQYVNAEVAARESNGTYEAVAAWFAARAALDAAEKAAKEGGAS